MMIVMMMVRMMAVMITVMKVMTMMMMTLGNAPFSATAVQTNTFSSPPALCKYSNILGNHSKQQFKNIHIFFRNPPIASFCNHHWIFWIWNFWIECMEIIAANSA